MLSTIITTGRKLYYGYPNIKEDVHNNGKFANLKIALVSDYLTAVNFSYECHVKCLTTDNYKDILIKWKPDFIFIESAFHGYNWSWSYKIANKGSLFGFNYLKDFTSLINLAKNKKIPTVFWNKDDGVFFDTFIEAASLCDYIYTADIDSVSHYNDYIKLVRNDVKHIGLLQMAVQPKIHNFTGFNFSKSAMSFVGSYYRQILHSRRTFLDQVFNVCKTSKIDVDVYDRNSNRLSRKFEFCFPKDKNLNIYSKLDYEETANIYKKYNVNLNVNSITDSPTMCSRRVLEILACGGIMVTNNSKAISEHFSDYCTVLNSIEEAQDVLPKMVEKVSSESMEKAREGSKYVTTYHSWEKRLEQLVCDLSL